MSEKQFTGKSAIVTGATRGIGKAIALELARRGANVAFNYAKSADEAEKLKAEIENSDVKCFAAQCDVANTERAADFVKSVTSEFGTVDSRGRTRQDGAAGFGRHAPGTGAGLVVERECAVSAA